MVDKDPRYEVENPEVKELLLKLGTFLGERMPEGWGFGLFIFNYGPDGSIFWISSADRQDMMKALREFIQKEQGN